MGFGWNGSPKIKYIMYIIIYRTPDTLTVPIRVVYMFKHCRKFRYFLVTFIRICSPLHVQLQITSFHWYHDHWQIERKIFEKDEKRAKRDPTAKWGEQGGWQISNLLWKQYQNGMISTRPPDTSESSTSNAPARRLTCKRNDAPIRLIIFFHENIHKT